MNPEDRRKLRVDLLRDLYNYYFDNDGKFMEVHASRIDSEFKLAYRYLVDLGFIRSEEFEHLEGKAWRLTITARGIDFVEEGKGKRRGDFQS